MKDRLPMPIPHGWFVVSYSDELVTSTQEMAENGVDSAHFYFVHQTAGMPETEIGYDAHCTNTVQRINLETPRGAAKGAITSRGIGPGQGYTRFTGIANTMLLGQVTPIENNKTHVRFAFTQPKINGEMANDGVNRAIVADICKQITEDIPIWENKIYREHPTLCDGDGPIAKFRKWYSQFHGQY